MANGWGRGRGSQGSTTSATTTCTYLPVDYYGATMWVDSTQVTPAANPTGTTGTGGAGPDILDWVTRPFQQLSQVPSMMLGHYRQAGGPDAYRALGRQSGIAPVKARALNAIGSAPGTGGARRIRPIGWWRAQPQGAQPGATGWVNPIAIPGQLSPAHAWWMGYPATPGPGAGPGATPMRVA